MKTGLVRVGNGCLLLLLLYIAYVCNFDDDDENTGGRIHELECSNTLICFALVAASYMVKDNIECILKEEEEEEEMHSEAIATGNAIRVLHLRYK